MHVGFLEYGYPLEGKGGGAGTFVEIYARELVAAGHQVTVVAPRSGALPTEVNPDGLTVVRPDTGGSWHYYLSRLPGVRYFRHAARYLEHGRAASRVIDDLHARNPFDLVEYSEGGDFWHRGTRKFKVVSHLHGSRYTFLKESGRPVNQSDWRQRSLELRFIRSADWVFSPAASTLGTVSVEARTELSDATVLPYPLDPEQWSRLSESNETSDRPVRIMFAARNDPVKGADILLEAVADLASSGRSVELHLFGFKPATDQIMPNWAVVNDFMPKRELLDRIPGMDVCVVPSFWDNSPNTVYEAMAAGKPVVASAVGGIPEIVLDSVTGRLVEPGNRESLVQALASLIDSPERRVAMGLAGRKRIRELADPVLNCRKRMEVYESVLSPSLSSPESRAVPERR